MGSQICEIIWLFLRDKVYFSGENLDIYGHVVCFDEYCSVSFCKGTTVG